MVKSKTAFYDASANLLEHVSDFELIQDYESDVRRKADDYIQSLLDLAASISADTKYKKALGQTADRIGPFIFELQFVIEYYRDIKGLET